MPKPCPSIFITQLLLTSTIFISCNNKSPLSKNFKNLIVQDSLLERTNSILTNKINTLDSLCKVYNLEYRMFYRPFYVHNFIIKQWSDSVCQQLKQKQLTILYFSNSQRTISLNPRKLKNMEYPWKKIYNDTLFNPKGGVSLVRELTKYKHNVNVVLLISSIPQDTASTRIWDNDSNLINAVNGLTLDSNTVSHFSQTSTAISDYLFTEQFIYKILRIRMAFARYYTDNFDKKMEREIREYKQKHPNGLNEYAKTHPGFKY